MQNQLNPIIKKQKTNQGTPIQIPQTNQQPLIQAKYSLRPRNKDLSIEEKAIKLREVMNKTDFRSLAKKRQTIKSLSQRSQIEPEEQQAIKITRNPEE